MPRGIYDRSKSKRAKSAKRSSKRKAPKRIERAAITARAIKRARKRIERSPEQVMEIPLIVRSSPSIQVIADAAFAKSVDARLSQVERVLRAIADHSSQMDALINSASSRCVDLVHDVRNEVYSALTRERETV